MRPERFKARIEDVSRILMKPKSQHMLNHRTHRPVNHRRQEAITDRARKENNPYIKRDLANSMPAMTALNSSSAESLKISKIVL